MGSKLCDLENAGYLDFYWARRSATCRCCPQRLFKNVAGADPRRLQGVSRDGESAKGGPAWRSATGTATAPAIFHPDGWSSQRRQLPQTPSRTTGQATMVVGQDGRPRRTNRPRAVAASRWWTEGDRHLTFHRHVLRKQSSFGAGPQPVGAAHRLGQGTGRLVENVWPTSARRSIPRRLNQSGPVNHGVCHADYQKKNAREAFRAEEAHLPGG